MSKQRKIFSQIYDRYVEKIYRFIFLKVNSQEIAEDLCSETFLRYWERFKEGQDSIENPQAFLYQISRNLVTDHYREKARTPVVSAEYAVITDPRTDLEERSLVSSDLQSIKAALASLKEDYQEVVIWHYLNDLSIIEIAKTLNKSEGAVRVMLHRALNALKKELGEGLKEA